MAYLGAVLGLRWGECAGLRVGRIDFDRSTITVAEQVTRGAGGRSVTGPPKSEAGRRTLAVPAALIGLSHNTLDGGASASKTGTPSSSAHRTVSTSTTRTGSTASGTPPGPRQASTGSSSMISAGANATGLVLEGIDLKTAQTRLGHTDPRLTLGIYAQASTEADRQAAERLGERFLPRRDLGRGQSLS
jgi:integrase